MNNLPAPIILEIAAYLQPCDLSQLACTGKHIRVQCTQEQIVNWYLNLPYYKIYPEVKDFKLPCNMRGPIGPRGFAPPSLNLGYQDRNYRVVRLNKLFRRSNWQNSNVITKRLKLCQKSIDPAIHLMNVLNEELRMLDVKPWYKKNFLFTIGLILILLFLFKLNH